MKRRDKLQGYLWFIAVVIFLIAAFSLTFYLTGWIFTILRVNPSPLLAQIINSLGGLFLLGTTITFLSRSRFLRSRVEMGQVKAFRPIIDALDRMAKGDFSVRVDDINDPRTPEGGILTALVNTVNQTALELNQMEQMRQEFISNVSHELQSPLTSIRGFAQVLQNESLSPQDRRHYLTIIETESNRLSRIAENLLKLASLESEQVKCEPKPYRLDKQIRSLILAAEPQWAGKTIDMDVSLEEVSVIADEDLLSQVWTNLLHNAIKFTPSNGRIQASLCRQDNAIRFTISDSGMGISPEHQAHVFERFYKVDASRTRSDNGGSGLGLSIAQKIIEMHKGTIAVQSQPSTGATFIVTLPAE